MNLEGQALSKRVLLLQIVLITRNKLLNEFLDLSRYSKRQSAYSKKIWRIFSMGRIRCFRR
ncbi:hypothetical protein CCL12_00155 [Pseudomonas syringae]|nr:hypothetical protein CCL12_00155 [Pseudomonas syringae]PBP85487.1 hypothetical protein CCL22_04230 [Pseudomonas syringae]